MSESARSRTVPPVSGNRKQHGGEWQWHVSRLVEIVCAARSIPAGIARHKGGGDDRRRTTRVATSHLPSLCLARRSFRRDWIDREHFGIT